MTEERPTTLLDDNWGASRPLTDEEWAEARRLERWRFHRALVIAVVVLLGAVVVAIALWAPIAAVH